MVLDIAIMGNRLAHKPAAVQQAIEKVGQRRASYRPIVQTPTPIEMAFAKFKAFLERIAARTVDDLWDAIA